jgi:hypothetical protein
MLLTVKDLSRKWQVPSSTIYAWAKQGKIPCIRLNSIVRFDPGVIAEFESSRTSGGQPLLTTSKRKQTDSEDLDSLIARAKRDAYTADHGETGSKSGLIGKEEHDGAHKKT